MVEAFKLGLFDKVNKRARSNQSKEQIDAIQFVANKLDERRFSASRTGKEAIWLTNIAYILGYDQVFYDPKAGVFKQVTYRVPMMRNNRVHSNLILPTIQNRVARLCKNPPRWEVPPNSMDQDDKDAARLSYQVLMSDWDRLKLNDRRIALKMWTEQCGYAFTKVCWDDMAGDLVDYDEESGEAIWQGDTRVDIVSAFEVYEDPGAKEWCETRDLIHAKVRHLSYFKDHYENGDLVKEEDLWLQGLQYQQRIEDINNNTGASSGQVYAMKNCAIEVAYYERPSRRYPIGRNIIYSNGVLLKDGILPGHKKKKRIPFTKFDCMVIGGRFTSEAAVTHMRPLQDQYNRLMTLRAAFANRTLYGKFLAAKGHGLAKTSMIDQSGEVVEYTDLPNHPPPQPLPAPILPEYSMKEGDIIKGDMFDIGATSEISRGQLPAAGMPAQGMEILLEADNTRMGIQTEKDEHAYADLGAMLLEFKCEYATEEQILKVAGKDSMGYTIKKYRGEDMKEHFDVRCKRGSTVPDSTVLRRQEILNAFDRGLLGDPMDPALREKVYAECEYGDVAETQKPYAMKKAYIQSRIIDAIEAGVEPNTSEFDDHKLIFDVVNEYRISDKYLKLSPEQQQMVTNVLETHLNFIVDINAPDDAAGEMDVPPPSTTAQDMLAQEMAPPMQEPGIPPQEFPMEMMPQGEAIPQEMLPI